MHSLPLILLLTLAPCGGAPKAPCKCDTAAIVARAAVHVHDVNVERGAVPGVARRRGHNPPDESGKRAVTGKTKATPPPRQPSLHAIIRADALGAREVVPNAGTDNRFEPGPNAVTGAAHPSNTLNPMALGSGIPTNGGSGSAVPEPRAFSWRHVLVGAVVGAAIVGIASSDDDRTFITVGAPQHHDDEDCGEHHDHGRHRGGKR